MTDHAETQTERHIPGTIRKTERNRWREAHWGTTQKVGCDG